MQSLKSFSDKELLNRLLKLVKQERKLTLEILPHLIEIENRKIYRALGFSSMFVYCTDGLGYSEASANRRICAARAIRSCPAAYDYLRDGRVNLSNLAIAWKYITPDLLDEIAGKSQRQVFTIVARFEPKIKHRDSTRPVMVRQPVALPRERQPAGASSDGPSALALGAPKPENPKLGEILHRSGGKKSSNDEISTPQVTPAATRPESEDKIANEAVKLETVKMHQVSCLVDDAVMQMLDRCKELLSGKHPCGIDFNTLLAELATTWLDKHEPARRGKRREKRKKSRNVRRTDTGEKSRHISPTTRDAVYKRDGGRCTFVGSNGKRCGSKWDLEIHHAGVPFALGGSHSINNLRLLCAAHNKLEAERVYGKRHMQIYDRKPGKGSPEGDNDKHWSVRESRVFYVPFGYLTPYRGVGTLALSDARGAYGFS